MDRLKEIFKIQESFTEKFFEKQGLSIKDVLSDKQLKVGFKIENLADEMGIDRRSIMLFCDLETIIPDYEEIRTS